MALVCSLYTSSINLVTKPQKNLAIDPENVFVGTFLTITMMTILASRYINKEFAKLTAVIASFFETAYGQLVWLESAGEADPWPPIYFFAIILFTGFFYLFSVLINALVKQKYDT